MNSQTLFSIIYIYFVIVIFILLIIMVANFSTNTNSAGSGKNPDILYENTVIIPNSATSQACLISGDLDSDLAAQVRKIMPEYDFRMFNIGIVKHPDADYLFAIGRISENYKRDEFLRKNYSMCASNILHIESHINIDKGNISKNSIEDVVEEKIQDNILKEQEINNIKSCSNLKIEIAGKWNLLDEVLISKHKRNNGIEDIRPFWLNGQLYGVGCAHSSILIDDDNYYSRMYLIKFNVTTSARDLEKLVSGKMAIEIKKITELKHEIKYQKKINEKNWGSLVHNGELYFIYAVFPQHLILKCDVKTGKVQDCYSSNSRIGNEYDRTCSPNKNYRAGRVICELNSDYILAFGHFTGNNSYKIFYYIFGNKPPFRIVWFSSPYNIDIDLKYEGINDKKIVKFYYPHHASYDYKNKSILWSMGVEDYDSILFSIPINELYLPDEFLENDSE